MIACDIDAVFDNVKRCIANAKMIQVLPTKLTKQKSKKEKKAKKEDKPSKTAERPDKRRSGKLTVTKALNGRIEGVQDAGVALATSLFLAASQYLKTHRYPTEHLEKSKKSSTSTRSGVKRTDTTNHSREEASLEIGIKAIRAK